MSSSGPPGPRRGLRLDPDSFAMTLVLALMTAMGPIATDLYVPSLPQIAQELATTPARVQWTMSAFLVGFAVGQMAYGPTSDHFGRKPALMTSFDFFIIASAVAAAAMSIEVLIGARLVQGLGAAGPIIIARAMVRDLHEGPKAGQQLAVMSTVMGLAPIAAPIAGGVIALWFSWRASFATMFIAVTIMTVIAATLLPETIRKRGSGAFAPLRIIESFRIVARSGTWRVYSSMLALSYTGLFTFISASPYVLHNTYGLSPLQFSMGLSACSICFVSGAAASSRLTMRLGLDGTLAIGAVLLAGAGLAQLFAVLLAPASVYALFVPELAYFAGIGFVLPNSVASSLAPFPERAGAASSLAGFLQMLFSAAVGIFVVAVMDRSALPLVVTTLVMGVLTAAIFFGSGRIRRNARR